MSTTKNKHQQQVADTLGKIGGTVPLPRPSAPPLAIPAPDEPPADNANVVNDLAALADAAASKIEQGDEGTLAALVKYRDAGGDLLAARNVVHARPELNWEGWVAQSVRPWGKPITARHANNLIRIHEKWDAIEAALKDNPTPTLNDALRAIKAPKDTPQGGDDNEQKLQAAKLTKAVKEKVTAHLDALPLPVVHAVMEKYHLEGTAADYKESVKALLAGE